jgi:hypothetical protein
MESRALIAVVWSNEEIPEWVGDERFGDALSLFSFEDIPHVVWSRTRRSLWPDASEEDRVAVVGVENGKLRIKRLDGPEYLLSIEQVLDDGARARLDLVTD